MKIECLKMQKKFVDEHIDAFKSLGENADRIMDKYDEAFKELSK